MRNVDDLLYEAKWGKLTSDEIAYIVSRIKESTVENQKKMDLYGLLFTLGRGTMGRNMKEHFRSLVEPFLYYPSDPMIARIAYIVLINCWDYDKEYLQKTKDFMRGVDWDEYKDVWPVAISGAGKFLRNQFDKELLEFLIYAFENSGDNWSNQNWVYRALARADGWDYADIPPPTFDLSELIEQGNLNLEPIEHAKAKLREHSSK